MATIINIQGADKSSISHNKYTQFNFNDKGVILNNYLSAQNNDSYIDSPLDSHIRIESNELLRKNDPAKVILNKVTSLSTPTILNETIEIAGTKADVIIANSQRIDCNDCGFINTDMITLAATMLEINYGNMSFLHDQIARENFLIITLMMKFLFPS